AANRGMRVDYFTVDVVDRVVHVRRKLIESYARLGRVRCRQDRGVHRSKYCRQTERRIEPTAALVANSKVIINGQQLAWRQPAARVCREPPAIHMFSRHGWLSSFSFDETDGSVRRSAG